MGTDLCLVWNQERVAELGRAHNYNLDSEITKEDLIADLKEKVLMYQCYMPKDLKELHEITEDLVDNIITDTCLEVYGKGKEDLLKDLRDQGFELMTDYEWDDRNKSQYPDKPDYIEPRYVHNDDI